MVSFLDKLRAARRARVVFIGLDGTPYTFLKRLIAEGRAPNAARLVRQGSLLRMDSTWPWVSSVAWSTMMTGVNPGKHNIFGFIDRDPATYKQFIPTSRTCGQHPVGGAE
jgi:predicted AlkP superfamily phosphohydrolase/phosphomutase